MTSRNQLRVGLALFVVCIVMMFVTSANAHTADEQAEWYDQWWQQARLGITPALLDELVDFQRRHAQVSHGPSEPAQPASASGVFRGMGAGVEQWRSVVAAHFPPNAVDTMLCLMRYESGGNPNAVNPTSGAAGLFQIMPFWWSHYGGDRYNPDTNVDVARRIFDQQGYSAWSPWNRGLCR